MNKSLRVWLKSGTLLTALAAVELTAPAGAAEFSAVIGLSSLDGSNGFRLDGAAGDTSGCSVASAGDVNGDGFADVIIVAVAAPGMPDESSGNVET
jgi:hypothetical protein